MPTKSMEQLKSMHVHVSNESQWWARLQELKQKWIRQSEAVESECRAMLEQSVSAHVNHAGFCAEVRMILRMSLHILVVPAQRAVPQRPWGIRGFRS